MHKVDFEKGVEGKRKGAFVIFYCLDWQPWQKYREKKDNLKDLIIPTCLLINRWDGTIGAIGGGVEEKESLIEAVRREVKEEIGHDLSLDLEPIVAHDIGKITTHAFGVQVSSEMILHIQKDAAESSDFGSELTGVFLPHLIDYNSVSSDLNGGIVQLYKSPLVISLREELTHLFLKKKIFSKSNLSNICSRAGFDMEELLK